MTGCNSLNKESPQSVGADPHTGILCQSCSSFRSDMEKLGCNALTHRNVSWVSTLCVASSYLPQIAHYIWQMTLAIDWAPWLVHSSISKINSTSFVHPVMPGMATHNWATHQTTLCSNQKCTWTHRCKEHSKTAAIAERTKTYHKRTRWVHATKNQYIKNQLLFQIELNI